MPSNASSYTSSCFSPLTIKGIWLAMSAWLRHWCLHCTCLRWGEINPWFLFSFHLWALSFEYNINTSPVPLDRFQRLGISPWISYYWHLKHWFKKLLKSNFDLKESKNNSLSIFTEENECQIQILIPYVIETIQACLVSHEHSLTRHWGGALIIRKNIFMPAWRYFAAFALQVLWQKNENSQCLQAMIGIRIRNA